MYIYVLALLPPQEVHKKIASFPLTTDNNISEKDKNIFSVIYANFFQ